MVYAKLTQELFKYISDLTITQIIEQIGAGKFAGDAVKYAYEKVKQKQLEGNYYFTPKPEELDKIKNIEKSGVYLRTKQLIPNHPLLGLLRLGIYRAFC